jgi:hypothetical protein
MYSSEDNQAYTKLTLALGFTRCLAPLLHMPSFSPFDLFGVAMVGRMRENNHPKRPSTFAA